MAQRPQTATPPGEPQAPAPGARAKVSVIIPSRDRPAGLCRAIDSVLATTSGHDVEIVVVLDEPDTASQEAMKAYPDAVVVVGGPGDAYLGRPQDKYNLGYAASTGDWIVSGSDDVTFDSPGWIDECLRMNRGGYIGLSDGGQDPRWVCVLVMASRRYIETVMRGYFGLPWYHVWWADVEWAERARQIGCYVANTRLKLTHHHHLRQSTPAVKDYIADLVLKLAPEDQITYTRRAARGFRDDHA